MEAPFMALRDRYKRIHEIVLEKYDYREDLSPDLENRKSVGASILRRYLAQSKAMMRNNLTLHLEPDDKSKADVADRMEVMQAHDLLMLDPQAHHRDNIHHFQSVGPFWAGWLEMHDFLPVARFKDEPEEDWAERNKKARESYFPFEILDKDPFSISYMEYNRKLTMAGTQVRLPYIDLMERYGESYKVTRDDPRHMLRICRDHFPFIRTDEGTAYEYSDWETFAAKEATVIIAADATQIWHCVDLSGGEGHEGTKKLEYLAEGEYPNPWGDVPLLLATGVYNPHVELAYRREGILHAAIEIEHAKALYKSYWASVTASPPERYEDPPDAVKQQLLDMSEAERPPPFSFRRDPKTGKPIIDRSLGVIREAERKVDEMTDKLYGVLSEEGQQAALSGVLFDPNAAQRLQNIPVSSILAQQDALSDLLGEAQRDEMNMWNRALDMLMHARKYVLNKGREKGDEEKQSDWGYSFKTTGDEKVQGRKIYAGESVKTTPQDYDIEFTRSINPYDNRASTRAAKRAEAIQARQAGALLYDQYLESFDIDNITEFKAKKYEEELFQIEAPRLVMDVRAKVAQFTAILNGSTIEQQLMGLAPEIANQLAGAFGQQQGYSTGSNAHMVQVASPQMENIGQGAGSQQQAGL